jgi:hypothetical protein
LIKTFLLNTKIFVLGGVIPASFTTDTPHCNQHKRVDISTMDRSESTLFHSYSSAMPSSGDSPNPLRPYYKPPSIGLPEPNPNQSAPGSPPLAPRRHAPNSSRDIRELFSDLDYGDYLPQASPSIGEMAKSLADRALWNYTATVMSQPFEVAKVVLQCYDAGTIPQSNGAVEARKTYTRESEVCWTVEL